MTVLFTIYGGNRKRGKGIWRKISWLGPWDMLDLLPGRYIAGVIYSRGGAGTTYELGGRVEVQVMPKQEISISYILN